MVSKGFRGAGLFGCVNSNLGCDFQRAPITNKLFEMLYMVSNGFRGGGWFGCVRTNLGCDFQTALITTKVVCNFVYGFKGVSWGRVVWVCEVKPRMQLSEGSYNKTKSLSFCIQFQRGFEGAGGLGV